MAAGGAESARDGAAPSPAVHAPNVEPSGDGAAAVLPGYRLIFPRDHGSHPTFRTEWWYVTGWLDGRDGPLGFQITFFRSRTDPALIGDNPSAFAPRQIIIAHAALSDPKL
ncbi:MAG: carotenoid 1,2-hydratase, partial [Proteobacteria bacterium]|nr:carotenoid 1,2-hydratase [Pseudomonadota bacterium]